MKKTDNQREAITVEIGAWAIIAAAVAIGVFLIRIMIG